jgi:hypothetical protein
MHGMGMQAKETKPEPAEAHQDKTQGSMVAQGTTKLWNLAGSVMTLEARAVDLGVRWIEGRIMTLRLRSTSLAFSAKIG